MDQQKPLAEGREFVIFLSNLVDRVSDGNRIKSIDCSIITLQQLIMAESSRRLTCGRPMHICTLYPYVGLEVLMRVLYVYNE